MAPEPAPYPGAMGVRADCRHYVKRTTSGGDGFERCRLEVNTTEDGAFACPEGCLFFEGRRVADAGWQVDPREGDTPR